MGMLVNPAVAILERLRGGSPLSPPMAAAPGTYIQGPYATTLQPQDEAAFQSWVKTNNVPWQDTPTADYDMRGYWQALQSADPNAKQQLSGFDGTMHFPDTYKTPFHKSFSNESKYATPAAPKWQGDRLVARDGSVVVDETPALTPAAAARIRAKVSK